MRRFRIPKYVVRGITGERGEPGLVYVLVTSRDPMVVKVGSTKYTAKGRAAAIKNVSGYRGFGKYTEVFSLHVSDHRYVEHATHKRLNLLGHKVDMSKTGRRELFRCGADLAIATIRAVVEKYEQCATNRTLSTESIRRSSEALERHSAMLAETNMLASKKLAEDRDLTAQAERQEMYAREEAEIEVEWRTTKVAIISTFVVFCASVAAFIAAFSLLH